MYGYKLGRLRQTRTLKSVGFQGGGGGGGGERDQAAAVTQQSISWNRRHTTQIPDCHQPSARKKRRYVKEQIGRMATAEGKESQRKRKVKEHERGKAMKAHRVSHKTSLFPEHAAQCTNTTIKASQPQAKLMMKIWAVCKPSAANIFFVCLYE